MQRNSLLKNVIFGFLSWFLPLGLSFVATPLIVRGLGVENFGVYTLVLGFVSYSFTFNVGRAILKYVSEFQANRQTEKIGEVISATLLLNLFVGGTGMTLLIFIARWLVADILKIDAGFQDEAVTGFYIAAVIIFMTMLNQSFSAVVQAVHRFDIYSYITVSTSSILAGGNILLIQLHPQIAVLLLWNLGLLVLSNLVFYFYGRRLLPDFKLTFGFPKEILWLVLKYSLAVSVSQLLGNLLLLFERSWIASRLGTEAVTYYVISLNLGIYIHAFITSSTLALFPLASAVRSLGETAKLLTIYTKATKIVFALAAFLCLTLISGRVYILHLWLGDDFVRNSSATLITHALTFGLLAVVVISFQIIEGAGLPGVGTIITLGWLILSVPLMVFLINDYGIFGVGAARLIGAMVFIPGVLYIEKKVFGRVQWRFWLKTLPVIGIACLVAAVVEVLMFQRLPISFVNLLSGAGLGGTVFGLTLLLTGFLSRNEKQWAVNLINSRIFKINRIG